MIREPHAITKARERYGLSLSMDDLAALNARCAAREGLVDVLQSGKRVHFLVFGDVVLPVLFSPGDGHIVTVFPKWTLSQTWKASQWKGRR